jgi:hypothetical protein
MRTLRLGLGQALSKTAKGAAASMVTVAAEKTKMGQPLGRKIITGELQADKKKQ